MWKIIGAIALILQLSTQATVNEVALNCKQFENIEEISNYLECRLTNIKSSNVVVTSSNVDLTVITATNLTTFVNIKGNTKYPEYFPTNLAAKIKGTNAFSYKETPLKFINRRDFKDFGPELMMMSLARNAIEEIPFDTFYDLTSLSHLDISRNKLTELNPKLFANSPLFDSLFVISNKLTELHPDLCSNCPQFRSIDAESNEIEKLDANLFKNNPKMTSISISRNKIKNIPIDFSRFKNLNIADFTFNAGTCDIIYYMFVPYVELSEKAKVDQWIKTMPEFQQKIEAVCRQ